MESKMTCAKNVEVLQSVQKECVKIKYFLIQWNSALQTPTQYGYPYIMDSCVCQDTEKVHLFVIVTGLSGVQFNL